MAGSVGPQVLLTHFLPLPEFVREQPDIKELAVLTRGNNLEWPARFRRAMRSICYNRAFPQAVPPRVMVAVVPNQGILLLWPCSHADERGFEVRSSPAGRRVTTDLAIAFGALGIDLPADVVTAIPATRYLHPVHGECMALHLAGAEFLPEKSRSAAGRMD